MAEATAPVAHLENGLIDVTPVGEYIAITNTNAQDSPLLRLPAELRAMIWRHVLDGTTIRPYVNEDTLARIKSWRVELIPPRADRFNLLRVSRQIYMETGMLPYVVSTFALLRYDDIRVCFESMPAWQKTLVQNVRKLGFRFGHKEDQELELVCETFPKLEEIKLHLEERFDSNMRREVRNDFAQRHGIAIEVAYSSFCAWAYQWASGDPMSKCKICSPW